MFKMLSDSLTLLLGTSTDVTELEPTVSSVSLLQDIELSLGKAQVLAVLLRSISQMTLSSKLLVKLIM